MLVGWRVEYVKAFFNKISLFGVVNLFCIQRDRFRVLTLEKILFLGPPLFYLVVRRIYLLVRYST